MNSLVSVVIATRNRPNQLRSCLQSLIKSKLKPLEIIVVDQSTNSESKNVISAIDHNLIRYFKLQSRGKSKSLNFGINKTKGELIAFTDDDCLVDLNWVGNIQDTFQKNSSIAGVFGQILPYKPQAHEGKICPSIFLNHQKKIISKPCLHWQQIGFGSNMAFRKKVFKKEGKFKTWLGPGSIDSNAEDAEFSLRLLLKGYKILYNPKIKVRHNRWLSKTEFNKLYLSYACGELACYGYFNFQGQQFAHKVVVNNFKDSYGELKKSVKKMITFKTNSVNTLLDELKKLVFRLRGLIVAYYFSKTDCF